MADPANHALGGQRPGVRSALLEEDTLAAEAASLESVRSALDREEPADAVRLLRAHRRRFPRGQLAAEADRVEIEALVRAGRLSEARGRGAVFLQRRGGSVYAPRVRALLEEIGP